MRSGAPLTAAAGLYVRPEECDRVVGHGVQDTLADGGGQGTAQLHSGPGGHGRREDTGDGCVAARFNRIVPCAVGAVGELPVEGQTALRFPPHHDAPVSGQIPAVAELKRKSDPGTDLGVRHIRNLADDQVRNSDDHLRVRGGPGGFVRGNRVLDRAGVAEPRFRVRTHGEMDQTALCGIRVDAGDDLPVGLASRVVDSDSRDARQVTCVDHERVVRGYGHLCSAVPEHPAHIGRLRRRPHVELLIRLDRRVCPRRQG